MTAPLFDEAARRLESFDPDSIPVDFGPTRLYLPLPRLLIRRRTEGDRPAAQVARSFGPEFDDLVEAVERASKEGSILDVATGLFALAADLLRRNYAIEDAELDRLCVLDPRGFDGGAIPEPWRTVWETASGLIPKSNGPGRSPAS